MSPSLLLLAMSMSASPRKAGPVCRLFDRGHPALALAVALDGGEHLRHVALRFGVRRRAVLGMSCISPCAPAGETACALKPDSASITPATSAGSTPWRRAASVTRLPYCPGTAAGPCVAAARLRWAPASAPAKLLLPSAA